MAEEYYKVKKASLEQVANAIREKSGTAEQLSFPDGFATAIDNIQTSGDEWETYYTTMWSRLQSMTSYNEAFNQLTTPWWCWELIKPISTIVPTSATAAFRQVFSLEGTSFDAEEALGDKFDFSMCTTGNYCFRDMGQIKKLFKIDVQSMTSGYGLLYQAGGSLFSVEVPEFKFVPTSDLTQMFTAASKVSPVTFVGVIASTQSFSYSNFDAYTGRSIISCLVNYSGTDDEFVNTITLKSSTWDLLNADTENLPPTASTWRDYIESIGWNIGG